MNSRLPSHIDPQHCILTRQYAVYTPPMEEMIGQIGDWIDQQSPGGYVYGPSRFGKTRAVVWYLARVLAERFGAAIPLVIWNHERTNTPTDGWFWHQLLLATKFEFVDPTKQPKKTEGRELCAQRFMALSRMNGGNHIILLIDEAHDVTLYEWQWLVGLQNRLDWEGFMLTVFSIGSHQLGYKHDYLASTGNAHVAARFMAAHAKYHGIRGVPDLKYVLGGYDID